MAVLGIQVFGLVFGIFVLYMSFLQWKKREFTINEWAFWSLFAIAFSTVSLFPNILNPVVVSLKLGRTLDLFIIVGFMFLIGALFYIYRIVRKVQKGLENLVRQLALESVQEPREKRK